MSDSQCAECGAALERGSFLLMEAEQPLCLACAGLAELEFLPAGDTALSRRASKHSQRTAVVVRFSRSRGRYERQGVVVETAALETAEQLPGCPPAERAAIAEHTAVRGSRRVGRTEPGRALEPDALTAAVVTAIRHRHTKYDELLAKGMTAQQRGSKLPLSSTASWQPGESPSVRILGILTRDDLASNP